MVRKKKDEGLEPLTLVLSLLAIAAEREGMTADRFAGYWGATGEEGDLIATSLYEVDGFGCFIMPRREDITSSDVLIYGIPLDYAEEHPEGFNLAPLTEDDVKALASMGIKA